MYCMSGATLRFIGEQFEPQNLLSRVDGAVIDEVNSTDRSGQQTVRKVCSLSSPFLGRETENFDRTLAFFRSRESQWVGAGLSSDVEIADLLASIRVHPWVGARFKFPAEFFRTLQSIHASLSIHFNNDYPSDHIGDHAETEFLDEYCVVLKNANIDAGEADKELLELFEEEGCLRQDIPMVLILPGLSARSRQTARFNLSHQCISVLADRDVSICLDVVGATVGRLIARKHKAAKFRRPQ